MIDVTFRVRTLSMLNQGVQRLDTASKFALGNQTIDRLRESAINLRKA